MTSARAAEAANLAAFRDHLGVAIIRNLCPSPTAGERKREKKRNGKGRRGGIAIESMSAVMEEGSAASASSSTTAAAEELSDFTDYLGEQIFSALPEELRTLSYAAVQNDASLGDRYAVPLDRVTVESLTKRLSPDTADSLCSCSVLEDASDLDRFLDPVFNAYVSTVTAAPPEHLPSSTAARPEGCQICGREHVPLTYHHLIPRQVHTKAVRRGWASEWELRKVAWLCRACHSFVHRVATNEELAREFDSVEALMEREDVRRFAEWVGRIRWKAR